MTDRSGKSITIHSTALNVIAAGLILYGLIYGASFLIPLVIAIIVVTILESIIERLERIGLPTLLAVPISVLVIVLAIAALVLVFVGQVDDFRAAWPRYVERLQTLAAGVFSRLGDTWSARLQQQINGLDLTRSVSAALGSAGSLLVNLSLVALYAGFLLAERGRLARRLISLGDTRYDRAQAVRTLSNISEGIRQYLFVKTVVSFFTGLLSYAVLKWLGVDFAEIWAVIIFLLNFIPSIGSILGVVFPALLALVQFDSLEPFLIIVGVLAILQAVIGNVIEPMMMGRTLNLSAFAVIVALFFWSAVWGVIGAFLSVPITAAFVIVCREIESLRWIAVLLSNEPEAPPREDAGPPPAPPPSST